ncbi:MAG: leucyl/phenylalanyl-tRNA--protein transferase [Spirochaetaceae bacterium]|nr:leucyl/phenylalanyl-tRNA--protein transferase [Spirochaetaceae bacterium]
MRRRRGEEAPFPYFGPEDYFAFPDPRGAEPPGIVCTGGNLSPGLLLSAYQQGIFPWFSEGEPILWWSPDPRFVLFPDELHVSDTMRKIMRRLERSGEAELSLDRDFPAVIRACSSSPRPGQDGTWISEDMIAAYCRLHDLGLAHSAEIRLDGELVGGLYGVSLGSVFFGESMFSRVPDASKAVFIPLVLRLKEEGFTLVDSQVYTDHLAGLGAVEIPRDEYLSLLAAALAAPTKRGGWGKLFPGFPASAEYRRLVPEVRP